MCKWGNTKSMLITIPADLSYNAMERLGWKNIDSCISDIVGALELHDIIMRSSCCGHGKCDGEIRLNDGRVLIIKNK